MQKIYTSIVISLFVLCVDSAQAQDNVSFEIIDKLEPSKIKNIEFEWPFNGPPPIGNVNSTEQIVDNLFSDNSVDCPPKRKQISDKVWECGNGKLIKIKDSRLSRLFIKAWEK